MAGSPDNEDTNGEQWIGNNVSTGGKRAVNKTETKDGEQGKKEEKREGGQAEVGTWKPCTPIALPPLYKDARPPHIKKEEKAKTRCWKTGVSPEFHRGINRMVYALSRTVILGTHLMVMHRRKDTRFIEACGNWDVPTPSEWNAPCQFC